MLPNDDNDAKNGWDFPAIDSKRCLNLLPTLNSCHFLKSGYIPSKQCAIISYSIYGFLYGFLRYCILSGYEIHTGTDTIIWRSVLYKLVNII